MTNHFTTIGHLIADSIENNALAENEILTGFSGKNILGCLQRFCNYMLTDQCCYVEVGVFHGLTLLSTALSVPKGQLFGIDNFAYFDKEGKNFSIVKDRIDKLKLTNVNIINLDYEEALENLSGHIQNKKVAVYFIDGPHDYRSQLMCLALIKPHLSPNAIIIVDDCNYNQVRQANRDFLLTNPEFKLLYHAYTKAHPMNLNEVERKEAQKGWWNGINIIVKDEKNLLQPMFPDCMRDKTLFEHEQLLHTCKYPLSFEKNIEFLGKIEEWKRKLKKRALSKDSIIGQYPRMNTYSEQLTRGELNPYIRNMAELASNNGQKTSLHSVDSYSSSSRLIQ